MKSSPLTIRYFKPIGWLISGFILLSTILYLLWMNFSLPFLTVDELNSIAVPSLDGFNESLRGGRFSTFISHAVNQVISFDRVNHFKLIPRFIAMLTLLSGLILTIRLVGFTWQSSILIGCITLLTHEIDWQHNGLVAFFGGYGFYLALFLIALYISLRDISFRFSAAIVFILIGFSYSSELFIALSLQYLIINFAFEKKLPDCKNPYFLSLLCYTFFLIIAQTKKNHTSTIANYLIGSYKDFSTSDIISAICVYLAGSIPHLKINTVNALYIAPLILLFAVISLLLINKSILNEYLSKGKGVATVADYNRLQVSCVGFTLLMLPPILMGMQPMKVNWAVNGMSYHYALNLYQWIGFAILVSMAFKYPIMCLIRKCRVLILFMLCLLLFFLISSAYRNVNFVRSYNESFKKWETLDKIAMQGKGVLAVDKTILMHPHIVPYDRALFDKVIKNVYKRELVVCNVSGYDLTLRSSAQSDLVYDDKTELSGFYNAESDGRWTNGRSSTIKFRGSYLKGDYIVIDVASVFGENVYKPIIFKLEDQSDERLVIDSNIVSIPIKDNYTNPTLKIIIPSYQSPSSIGIGNDDRHIGIKIRRFGIIKSGANPAEFFNSKVCN